MKVLSTLFFLPLAALGAASPLPAITLLADAMLYRTPGTTGVCPAALNEEHLIGEARQELGDLRANFLALVDKFPDEVPLRFNPRVVQLKLSGLEGRGPASFWEAKDFFGPLFEDRGFSEWFVRELDTLFAALIKELPLATGKELIDLESIFFVLAKADLQIKNTRDRQFKQQALSSYVPAIVRASAFVQSGFSKETKDAWIPYLLWQNYQPTEQGIALWGVAALPGASPIARARFAYMHELLVFSSPPE